MLVALVALIQAASCAALNVAPPDHATALQAALDRADRLQHYNGSPAQTELNCYLDAAYALATRDVERAASLQARMMLVMRTDDWTSLSAIVDEGLALTADGSPESELWRQQFYTGLSFVRRGQGDEAGALEAANNALRSAVRGRPDTWQTFGDRFVHRATGLDCTASNEARLIAVESYFPDHGECVFRTREGLTIRAEAYIPDPIDPSEAANRLSQRVQGAPVVEPHTMRFWTLPITVASYTSPSTGFEMPVWSGWIGDTVFVFLVEPERELDMTANQEGYRVLSALAESLIAGYTPTEPSEWLASPALHTAQLAFDTARTEGPDSLALWQSERFARVAERAAISDSARADALRLLLSVALERQDPEAAEHAIARIEALTVLTDQRRDALAEEVREARRQLALMR